MRSPDDVMANLMAGVREMQRKLDESPHTCAGGCATKMLKAGIWCPDCDNRRQADRERRGWVAATKGGLPTRFKWATSLSAPEMSSRVDQAALARARELDLAAVDRATFVGPAGSGKSSVACALACAWSERHGALGRFIAAVDLGVARQQAGLGDGEAPLVQRAAAAPLLVLDDVGAEAPAGSAVVEHVIRARYDDAKPTIFTSGLTVDQIVARYGSGVARRLVEAAGGAVVIKFAKKSG